MPPEVPPAIVAFVTGAMLATAITVLVGRRIGRERHAARSAVADLREEWLDPFADHMASLAAEEREQTRQVKEVHSGLDAVHDRLAEVLGWRDDVERRRRAASPAARALADVIAAVGTQRECFIQLGRAVFVTANRQLGVAFLTGEDLTYLEEHPELITAPDR